MRVYGRDGSGFTEREWARHVALSEARCKVNDVRLAAHLTDTEWLELLTGLAHDVAKRAARREEIARRREPE